MTFKGFPMAAFDFYDELEHNNTREWWAAHKSVYHDAVETPLRELADLLADEFGEAKLFRPYRDVRFSNDKSPIKTAQGMVVAPEDGRSVYLHIAADGLFVAGGWYQPTKEQLEIWRHAADTQALAASFDRKLAAVRRSGFDLMEGGLKTAPRGWPRDHPRIDMLRRTNLAVARQYEPEPWLHTAKCADHVRQGWRVVRDWGTWLCELPPPE